MKVTNDPTKTWPEPSTKPTPIFDRGGTNDTAMATPGNIADCDCLTQAYDAIRPDIIAINQLVAFGDEASKIVWFNSSPTMLANMNARTAEEIVTAKNDTAMACKARKIACFEAVTTANPNDKIGNNAGAISIAPITTTGLSFSNPKHAIRPEITK